MGQDGIINQKTAEIIKDHFYFSPIKPKVGLKYHCFSVDNDLIYEGFNNDFGPLNLAQLYKYCLLVKDNLKQYNILLHYSHGGAEKLDNAAYLVGSYAIIYLDKNAHEMFKILNDLDVRYIPFRDASLMPTQFTLTLKNVFEGVEKALSLGFLNFQNFNVKEYEHYEKVENGDMNWIIPGRILAFCGPESTQSNHNKTSIFKNLKETPTPGVSNANCNHHPPEFFVPYFKKYRVGLVVRLNEPDKYNPSEFTTHGIAHKDLYFPDGAIPTEHIVREFLNLCALADEHKLQLLLKENGKSRCTRTSNTNTNDAIAVHCKAGLGRTGTLIACYLMSRYKFTAPEAISWIRICRPGSILGHQQNFLEKMQDFLWNYYESSASSGSAQEDTTTTADDEDSRDTDVNSKAGIATSPKLLSPSSSDTNSNSNLKTGPVKANATNTSSTASTKSHKIRTPNAPPSPPALTTPRHYFHSPLKNLRSRGRQFAAHLQHNNAQLGTDGRPSSDS